MKIKYILVFMIMLITLTSCGIKKNEVEQAKEETNDSIIFDTEEDVVDENIKELNDSSSTVSVDDNKNKTTQTTTTQESKKEIVNTKTTESKTDKKQSKKVEVDETTTKEVTTTEKVKENVWDKLGMTENQYYNEPMYSWEKVDFSVEKYGSESEATKACINYGDSYQDYIDGKVLYHCSTVTSASGKYLGEMFHTETLN